jgi:hypothetical protein
MIRFVVVLGMLGTQEYSSSHPIMKSNNGAHLPAQKCNNTLSKSIISLLSPKMALSVSLLRSFTVFPQADEKLLHIQ